MNKDNDHATKQSFEEGDEAPPPGVRMMAIVRWCLLIGVALAALFSVYTYASPLLSDTSSAPAKGARYICPMHPQIISDHPGECPICHMDLVLAPETAAPPPSASASVSASAPAPGSASAPGSAPGSAPPAGSAAAPGS